MDITEIKQKVDDLVKWDKLQQECKREIDILKGDFQKLGEDIMKDQKRKQVEFWGTGAAKVVVTESETLKVCFRDILKTVLGQTLDSFEKAKVTYDYSDPFKAILVSIFQGTYIDQRFTSLLDQLQVDDKVKAVLEKKLKGKWDQDIKTLMNVAGMSKEDAEFYAYQVQESKNYERILSLLKAAGYEPGIDAYRQALEAIKSAVVVEVGLKVGIESEN